MQDETFFDWALFLPQKALFELFGGIHNTADLSAAFIWLIAVMLCLICAWLGWRGFLAWRGIAFLNHMLGRIKTAELPTQRRELRQLAAKRSYEGGLWLAFDAAWVESADGKRIYKTQFAEEFFNIHNLSRGIAGNRLLGAMPGILTAFGILGTFVGLQIGLSSLDLSAPQELSQSIVPLIRGAAVAFATSVWGTLASVLFNFLEKTVEQSLRKRINRLQQRADSLLPLHVPEQTLIHLERAGIEAENALKGLAEQIGQQMQKALLDVPQQIQAGIEASMKPAVERLVEAAEQLAKKQGSSSQQALEKLIGQFVGSVNESGENSRKGLENVTAQLGESLSQWNSGMNDFLGRLDERAGALDNQVGSMLEQGKTLREDNAQNQQYLASVAGELHRGGELLQQATKNLQTLGEGLSKAAQQLSEAQLQAAKLTEVSARKQQESSRLLEKISASLDQAHSGLAAAGQSLKASAELAGSSLTSVSESQKEFVDGLRKTLTALRKQVGEMMADYATDVEEQTKARMEQWNRQTQDFSKNMVTAVTAMNEILGEIDAALARRRP